MSSRFPPPTTSSSTSDLLAIYQRLLDHFGPRGWWPGDTPTEIMVGALLTQSVAWRNVVMCLERLKAAELLDWRALHGVDEEVLHELIRPSRYYRAKAKKLKALAAYVVERCDGDLDQLWARPWEETRAELLSVHGLGPETVDSILLYAGGQPTFVVDAYTQRIFARLGRVPHKVGYERLRAYFMDHLPCDVALFNEYHALIVGLGHHYCHPQAPRCGECPLGGVCVQLVIQG